MRHPPTRLEHHPGRAASRLISSRLVIRRSLTTVEMALSASFALTVMMYLALFPSMRETVHRGNSFVML
jgi:hypothetical protein